MRDLGELCPGARVRVLSSITTVEGGRGRSRSVVYVVNVTDEELSEIRDHEAVHDVKVLVKSDSSAILKVSHDCPLAGAFIRTSHPTVPFRVKCGVAEWKATPDEEEDLARLVSELRARGLKAALRRSRARDHLTPRQKLILMRAVEEGYYNYPRRITLSELAKKLGISKAYLSETLMKVESKLLGDLVP